MKERIRLKKGISIQKRKNNQIKEQTKQIEKECRLKVKSITDKIQKLAQEY